MATVLIGRCHISMNQNNNFEWKIVSHLVSVRLPFCRILRNIFIFRFRVRKQTSKKRSDRWIFWNSAGIDRIETNRIVMQDSGQANQNAEQAKPRTTNQLDYIKKVVFKSVAKHKHAWPFQVKRIYKKIRIINLHKLRLLQREPYKKTSHWSKVTQLSFLSDRDIFETHVILPEKSIVK